MKLKHVHRGDVWIGDKGKRSYWGCSEDGFIQVVIDKDWKKAESQDLGIILRKCWGKSYAQRILTLIREHGYMKLVIDYTKQEIKVMCKNLHDSRSMAWKA